jgi:hypothetical protein
MRVEARKAASAASSSLSIEDASGETARPLVAAAAAAAAAPALPLSCESGSSSSANLRVERRLLLIWRLSLLPPVALSPLGLNDAGA